MPPRLANVLIPSTQIQSTRSVLLLLRLPLFSSISNPGSKIVFDKITHDFSFALCNHIAHMTDLGYNFNTANISIITEILKNLRLCPNFLKFIKMIILHLQEHNSCYVPYCLSVFKS